MQAVGSCFHDLSSLSKPIWSAAQSTQVLPVTMQRVAADGMNLDPARLCYLVTRAGADAVGLGDEIGDFRPGKAADLVYIRPPADSSLAEVLSRVQSLEESLAAIFTLAGPESVREVRVAGQPVHRAGEPIQGRLLAR